MSNSLSKSRRQFLTAMLFLLPNILGVLAFVVFPLCFAIMMAFTNWDLRLHNMWHDEPLKFIGLQNFVTLIKQGDFLRYFGNTLFLMMMIPLNIAASLVAALLLSKDTNAGGGKLFIALICGAVLVASTALLSAIGFGASAMTLLFIGLGGMVLIGGVTGGTTVYRTMFYCPTFVAGVATFILWKKLYNPTDGPINNALAPVFTWLTNHIRAMPSAAIRQTVDGQSQVIYQFTVPGVIGWTLQAIFLLLLWWGVNKVRRMWRDGELGSRSLILPLSFMLIPSVVAVLWDYVHPESYVLGGLVALIGVAQLALFRRGRVFEAANASDGFGSALMLALVVMVGQFILLGLAATLKVLPGLAAQPGGLPMPQWLASYELAKPALMIMGFWAAVGSNNMLLYIAALTNVPPELYEASDIDGASRFQRFWYVTWPQLAPTTFFIAVMSTIWGLQGGFEAARTMTEGGPAGSTTTLSYFIYNEGFETGRLGFAAATAWALFALVFVVTIFNWRFGNRYVND